MISETVENHLTIFMGRPFDWDWDKVPGTDWA
jgi:hypothetical protein